MRFRRNSVTALLLRYRFTIGEVAAEVLLARQIRTPRRPTGSTVGQGADHQPAGRVERGAQGFVAGGGTGNADRRLRGDTACVLRWPHDCPALVVLHHFDDGY